MFSVSTIQVNQNPFCTSESINRFCPSVPRVFTLLSSNHSLSCGQNKVHFIRANKQRSEQKLSSCSDQGNNPTAQSPWLFSSICFIPHHRKTLNRPSSAVLTDNVLIKTSSHMLRQLPKPITNDQLIILGPLLFSANFIFSNKFGPYAPETSAPTVCFPLKTAFESVFPKR